MNNEFTLSAKAVLKREGLRESTKEVMTVFEKFLKDSNINAEDEKDPMAILYREALRIESWLYDRSYKTVRDIAKAEGKLDLIKKYIRLIQAAEKH